MKISREKLFDLNALFNKLSSEKTNVRFHYTIAKNKRLVTPELECLQEARNPSESFTKFQEKRIELCKQFCKKDEDGMDVVLDPGTPQSRFDFDDEQKELLEKAMKSITEEYKEAIEEQNKKEEDFYKILKEEVDLPLHLFQLKNMPEEILGSDVDLLFDLIEE